jgi:hypothetical protein
MVKDDARAIVVADVPGVPSYSAMVILSAPSTNRRLYAIHSQIPVDNCVTLHRRMTSFGWSCYWLAGMAVDSEEAGDACWSAGWVAWTVAGE